jgi:anti-sigma B factor antagonist
MRLSVHTAPSAALVVDLTGVTFIGSAGLSTLLAEQLRRAEHDGELVVVANERPVRRAITRVGLSDAITMTASLADALAIART